MAAGDLLAGLADGDWLADLAVDVDGLAVNLQALRRHSQLLRLLHHLERACYLQRMRRAMVGLQLVNGFFTQGDDVHLLRLVALQHANGVSLRDVGRGVSLSDQRQVLDLPRRLGEEGDLGVGRMRHFSVGGDQVDLLILTRNEVDVVHPTSHHQLDLLLRAERRLVRLQMEDAARLLRRRGWRGLGCRGGGSLLVVRLCVRFQVVRPGKGKATEGAGEGFLPRVGGDVASPRAGV